MTAAFTQEAVAGSSGAAALAEKRSEPRRLVREPAILQLLRPRNSERFKVYILDVSDGGLGIWTPVALQPGAFVKVRLQGSVVLTGEVRYIARSGDEFQAGVKLQDLDEGPNPPSSAIW